MTSPPGPWRPMSVGLIVAFMTLLDVSIVNVALPSIQSALRVGHSGLQWILSGYALAFGLLLVPAGRFGDTRGRRDVFVAGLTLFTLASAAAGLASSELWLVVARLVQGAAAGIVNPQVSGVLQELFRPADRGRPFGLLGATVGISTAVGPLLGGILIRLDGTADGWRWVFYINVPVGIVAMVLGWRWIPAHPARPPGARRGTDLDLVGVVLLGAAVVLLLLPLAQERQWSGLGKWLLIPASLVLFALFAAWERRYSRFGTPLVELALFRVRSYTLGVVIGVLYFAGFTANFFILTLFLQSGLGYSALGAGLAIIPFALGSAGAAALSGRIVTRFGRPLVARGLAIVAVGLIATMTALALVPGHNAPLATALPLFVTGLGSGMVITPNQTLTLAEVPVGEAGSAGGVLQTGQRIGAALGIAGVGSVFFARLASTDGHWAVSVRAALVVTTGFILTALACALTDVLVSRRSRRAGRPG